MTSISCESLVKSFGDTKALDHISFTIEENKITGLIGRNGAGKSTLLKTIAGHLKETSGQVTVLGSKPFNNLAVLSNLIYIDDNMAFPKTLGLGQIISHAAALFPKWDYQLADRLMKYFDLDPSHTHTNLSKGKRSTFNMILGLAAHATVTLFDEPTSGMDIAVRKDFYRALLKDYIAHPRTIIFSSHLLNEIEDLLEDILLIKNGRLCAHMSVDELRQMAIGLRGSSKVLSPIAAQKEALHIDRFGMNEENMYLVVKNNLAEEEIKTLKKQGIEFNGVAADDLCVWLTMDNDRKGGIDDVFKAR